MLARVFTSALALIACLTSVAAAPAPLSAEERDLMERDASVTWAPKFQNFNDWNCKSTDKPPVILMHALGTPSTINWVVFGTALAKDGYCVFTPQYGTRLLVFFGWESMRKSSKEIAAFVQKVRASTGADKVNLGGHSMGTTVAAYYMKFDGGAAFVKHFVGFGANYKGTTLYGVNKLVTSIPLLSTIVQAACASCREFLSPSDLIRDLNSGGVSVPGPDYTTIASKIDEVVLPPSSGRLDGEAGVTNIWLQDKCPSDLAGHILQAVDPNVLQIMRWAFAGKPGGQVPQGCSPAGAYP